jgi:hypothetical protein
MNFDNDRLLDALMGRRAKNSEGLLDDPKEMEKAENKDRVLEFFNSLDENEKKRLKAMMGVNIGKDEKGEVDQAAVDDFEEDSGISPEGSGLSKSQEETNAEKILGRKPFSGRRASGEESFEPMNMDVAESLMDKRTANRLANNEGKPRNLHERVQQQIGKRFIGR